MKTVVVYLRLYADCLVQAVAAIAKNPWTLLLPIALPFLFTLAQLLPVFQIRFVGGVLWGLLFDAVASCYLYFTAGVVAKQKLSIRDWKTSIAAYFWSVMGLLFVLWVASYLLSSVLARNPNAVVIMRGFSLLVLIILNPAPEVIYQKGTRSGTDTVSRSIKFIHDAWIEWFIPNGLIIATGYWAFDALSRRGWFGVPALLLTGAVFHVVMVFRGFLFDALDSSSHRQRMYRYHRAG